MKKLRRIFIFIVAIFCLYALNANRFTAAALDEKTIVIDKLSIVEGDIHASFTVDDVAYDVNLSQYDLYSIVNENNKIRYYIADALADVSEFGDFTVFNIMVYNRESLEFDFRKPMTLSISSYIRDLDNVVKAEKTLTTAEYRLVTRSYQSLQFGDDELSQRLQASMNLMVNYQSQATEAQTVPEEMIQALSIPVNGTYYANDQHNLVNYTYSYTTDTRIDSYLTTYWRTNYNSSGKLTDDYIIQIVPRSLMFSVGKYAYVGKEYGFFINTTLESSDLYVSDVLIFDIDTLIPGLNTNFQYGKVTVKPQYQFRYYARNRASMPLTEWNKTFDNAASSVVYLHPSYDAPNYYLANIAFRFTIANSDLLNPGEAGYNKLYDEGKYIITGKYEFNGTGKTTGRNDWVLPYVFYNYGYLNAYSGEVNTPEYTVGNLYTPQYSNLLVTQNVIVENGVSVNTLLTNRYDQLNNYANLVKSMVIYPERDATNPLLIGTTGGHYAAGSVKISYGTYSDYTDPEAEFHTSVYTEIVSDDTYYLIFDWFPKGQVNFLTSCESSFYHHKFRFKPAFVVPYVNCPSAITVPGASEWFLYRANSTSDFIFQTYGDYDTVMEAYSPTLGYLTTDDDSGQGRNSWIHLKMNANEEVYLIVTFYSKTTVGDFDFEVTYQYQNSVYVGTPLTVTITNNWVNIRFYAPSTGRYGFETLGDTDTVLKITDTICDYLLILDDDGGQDWNSYAAINMEANTYYNIRISLYGLKSGITTLTVTKIE